MGFLKNGPFGPLNGKVGNLVSYELMGKNVTRISVASNAAPSIGQLACRQELAVVIKFLKPVKDFINVGFKVKAAEGKVYPHNAAVSVNKRNALTGAYPDLAIDYAKVLVAQGTLQPATGVGLRRLPEGIEFSWDVPDLLSTGESTQSVMLLAYFPSLEAAVYCINGAKRNKGKDVLLLDMELRGVPVELYLSFISVPDNHVADSVYAGRL